MKLLVTKSPMDIGAGGRYWHERATSQRGEKRKEGGRKEAAHDSTTRPLFSPPPTPRACVSAWCARIASFFLVSSIFSDYRTALQEREKGALVWALSSARWGTIRSVLFCRRARTRSWGTGRGLGPARAPRDGKVKGLCQKKRPLIQW